MVDDEKIIIEIKKRLTKVAIDHLRERINVRAMTIFQKNGMFKSLKSKLDTDEYLPIFNNANHSDWKLAPLGPLLFHIDPKEKLNANVITIAELLFSTNMEMRKAVCEYYLNLNSKDIPILLDKTKALLNTLKDRLLDNDEQQWREAAVAIYDAIDDDWYCNYAAVKQCLIRDFTDGIKEYLTKIIRPTISSVETITTGMWAASEQKDKMLLTIKKNVEENPDLKAALDQYFNRFGHLPLAENISIAGFIKQWQDKYGEIENVWTVLWEWADSYEIPLPMYHVCTYFVLNPKLVPKDKYRELWHEIAEIIYIPNKDEDNFKWTQSWKMLCEIARHYCYYLETRLPYKNGERIASQAWWLSMQVCNLFTSDQNKVQALRKEGFLPEMSTSMRIWEIASPCIQPSSLNCLSIYAISVFSISMAAMLSKSIDALHPELIDPEDFKKIELSMTGAILGVFSPKPVEESVIVYAYEYPILDTAKKWLGYMGAENKNKEMLEAFIGAIEKLKSTETLKEILINKMDSHIGDQVLIASYFRNLVMTGPVSLDDVWSAVDDLKWREAAIGKSHPMVLELIFDALNEIQTRYQDKWAYNLPHFYAMECEKVKEKDKRQHLFGCLIHSSICGNAVSGIQRLLKGENRFEYKDDVDYWRQRLGQVHKWAPDWVRAKIRPILAVLYI